MSYELIQKSLDTRLLTVTDLPTLYKENSPSAEKSNTKWVRSTLLPAQPIVASLGINGQTQFMGLYQIDCFFPKDRGFINSASLADDIIAIFTKGLYLTTEGLDVLVELSWKQPSSTFGTFYSTPVVVQWSVWL